MGADEQLVERARKGDRLAQQMLWRAHRRWVAAIILAHRPRWIELEDLLQDVAVKLVEKIHTLRDAEAFRPWLRQIALNVCRGAARASRAATHLAPGRADATERDGRAPEPVEPGEPHERLESSDAARRVLEQALTLPVAYREPLLLRCIRSMTYEQIGEVLGLPVTTVETRLARARRMLREECPEIETARPGGGRKAVDEERP